ncbi:hypothetical protein ACUW1X_000816 [Enterobacter hormaechei]
MTKTSHSKIYSTESGITGGGFFKTHPLHFTKEQLEWIENIQLPKRLFLISATEFDDRYLYLHDDWRYRFSGNNLAILFSTGKYFCDLSPVSLKLLKYLTIAYINENSASVADKFAQFVAKTFKQIEVITRESLIEKMQMLVAKTERNHSDSSQFYYTLYALRKLDRNGFFESKDDSDELEDLLLEVPRPRNNNWARYQNLDLVIPEEVCLMIENGIQRWASKLCPKIDVEENKNIHLETVRKTIKIDTLRDCIIIGIVYYIGARPVQIGKLSGGDFIVDTENKYGMRYSVLVPYAKKSKLTIDRVRVAIPEELGKLILLYKYLVGIGDTDPMFSIIVSSMKMVEASLKKMLFRFSPQEIQEAVKNDDYQLPVYTASLFRHNVGHSMAMSGASAPEIAYILGQSSYVVADRYIAATPELADIREAALGRNPVFKNMMALMLTGNLVHSSEWEGRNVAGSIGGQLHYHLGGCNYEEDICPFAQGRGCKIADFPDEWIEQNYLEDIMFSGSGGSRNDLGKSIRNSIANFSGHKPKVIPVHKQKNSWYFTKEQLNDYVYQRYAQAKNFEPGHQCIISAKNNGDWEHFNYEDLMFIMPEGAFGIGKDFVSLQHIFPLDENSIEAWLGGTQNRKSIFDHFNLFEDDGSRVIIKKHVPRHNINTFLAIAGVTDHIQAILMGRVDITQNKHYQHQAESQSYQTASLAINMLEKAYDENNQALTKSFQLSLFTTQQKPCIPVNLPSPRTEVSRRMAALSRSSKTVKNTGVGNVKLTTSLMINPELNTEHNLKQNMQTFGETTAEVVDYITGTMSDKFLPELKRAHDKLVQQNLADKAKSLLQRHAKLHPLGFGACTRDVARWGCPHALKCQSGLPCGYFTLTGRLGEAEEASRRLSNKRKEIIQLRKLTIVNPGFMLALKEQEEALIVLEALEADAIKVQGEKKLVSLFSDDLNNPLYKVIERINKQMLIGKTPKTLADLFFIEQKRIERNNNG